MHVKFFLNEVSLKIPQRKRLKQHLLDIFRREGVALSSLTYVFCTDKYLLSINKEFLGHNDYTDIVSFTLSEPSEAMVGEIYISAERVKENAAILGLSLNTELHRVIFHGALHLCGYKDKTVPDKHRMTLAEDLNLRIYFG